MGKREDLGLKQDVGLLAITVGGSKGFSWDIASRGLNISGSMWKDLIEGQKYLGKLNGLKEKLKSTAMSEEGKEKIIKEYATFISDDVLYGSINTMEMEIEREKDPKKKKEMEKELEKMKNLEGQLSNTIFGTGGGLNIIWEAGKYENVNGNIYLDGKNYLNSMQYKDGKIQFNLSLAAVNTALIGHEWMHDGVKGINKEKTIEEEASCIKFQNVILEGLIGNYGSDILFYNEGILKDYLAYVLYKQAKESNPEKAEEILAKYIESSHDISEDLWKLVKKDGKIIATAEKGDTFTKLLNEIMAMLPEDMQNILKEKMKDKNLWHQFLTATDEKKAKELKDSNGTTLEVGDELDISSFFEQVLGIKAENIEISEQKINIKDNTSILNYVEKNIKQIGGKIVKGITNLIDGILSIKKEQELNKEFEVKWEEYNETEKNNSIQINKSIDINKALDHIAKDLIRVLKLIKEKAKDKGGKNPITTTTGLMFYENIFVDTIYNEKLKDGDEKQNTNTGYNPLGLNSLVVVIVDGKIAGLAYGSTLPVKMKDLYSYDGKEKAVIASGLYMAFKSTYHGGDCYRLYQTIFIEGEGTKKLKIEDYKNCWESTNGNAQIPVINRKEPANGILVHIGYNTGSKPYKYPSEGCLTIGSYVKPGLMNWQQVWEKLMEYYYIFVYVNRDLFNDYDDYNYSNK